MNITNEIQRIKATEKDFAALDKAKTLENKRLKKGYKYFDVNSRTKILIECDKDGNPTTHGKKVLDEAMARYK